MGKKSDRETRYLDRPRTETPAPLRATGPLDEELPWVIEFRVVGTASTIQVQVQEAMTIGRSDPQRGVYPDVDLGPHGAQHRGVSRQHAVVIARENRIVVKDLGSVNGTRLNGRGMTPDQEYRLRHGDELEVGELKLQVRFAVVPTLSGTRGDTLNHAAIPVIGKGQHVLVVEDDEDVGKVFSIALEHAGFRVSVANSVVSALGFVSHQLPDAIVLDLLLPDMSGLDLLRYVRKEFKRHVPMIVVSGATGGFQANQAKDIGADVFLGKPISVEDLVRAVASFLVDPADITAAQ
ncbi:MAG: response regulator [Chloroflexi bacterium]|jgi:two-component system phosphate regulon response regulator PhoB|nr:response regulator [Chloroflexota bacterium]MDL1885825.1 response regulator [Anaerolineae bacterium CFX8]